MSKRLKVKSENKKLWVIGYGLRVKNKGPQYDLKACPGISTGTYPSAICRSYGAAGASRAQGQKAKKTVNSYRLPSTN